MSELEEKIAQLEKRLLKYEKIEEKTPTFSFSKITDSDLYKLVDIKEEFDKSIFNDWFDKIKEINNELELFLNNLISKHINLIYSYNEEDLKLYFLAPLFNKIDFQSMQQGFRAFYNERIFYQSKTFIFNGEADFLLAKGLKKSKQPYFFIQEFKKGKKNSDPEPQLLAEMIAGLEISKVQSFRGAYIIGAIWNFVILEKIGEDSYKYYVSLNFDSTKIEDLKGIYKNLMFIKEDVIRSLRIINAK